jgi:hypothetical protein
MDVPWDGRACQRPLENADCLVLPRIHQDRRDEHEIRIASRTLAQLPEDDLPPCVRERSGFMSAEPLELTMSHPYTSFSEAHKHLGSARLRIPAYSAACVPFNWMRMQSAKEIVERLDLDFREEIEERARELMGFDSSWVQEAHNQRILLDSFFSAVRPLESICFFYAKQTPLLDISERILIGAARAAHVGEGLSYPHIGSGELDSVVWERPVQHTLRPSFDDGFLLPYHDILALAAVDPSVQPTDYVALAPPGSWWEFSYASELVSNDSALGSLLSCQKALARAEPLLDRSFAIQLRWLNEQLHRVWRLRGPFPGLGAALSAFGVPQGVLVAYELSLKLNDNEDPWPLVARAFVDPADVASGLERHIGDSLREKWQGLPDERRALLKLISRFDLSPEQATRMYQPTERERARITVEDRALIENPYLLYELDRLNDDPIEFGAIDRGAFPAAVVREIHPLPEPSALTDPTEVRRVRALIVVELETAAASGDTVRSRADVIQGIRQLSLDPPAPVDDDLINVFADRLEPMVMQVQFADGQPGFQLDRLAEARAVIAGSVERRLRARRHEIEANWPALLTERFGPLATGDEAEARAREEKAAALAELAAARLSVLVGAAGTGKTTLLSMLCELPQIRDRGVLLLAPTGKARVQMETTIGLGLPAKTIAQFLVNLDRYDPATGNYHRSASAPESRYATVIVDECSMMTEEQLAALIDGISNVQRLVLVGDPRQLPPIGSGRPFVDLVSRLRPAEMDEQFPRIVPSYCELTVLRRQAGARRADLLLAEWFSGTTPSPGADEIWDIVREAAESQTLGFESWSDEPDLRRKLLEVLVSELRLQGSDDSAGFEASIGGTEYEGRMYFWRGRSGNAGAASLADDWQILSPLRGQAHGVVDLNRFIQRHFRQGWRETALNPGRSRKIPKPVGLDEIVYGDKVINVVNRRTDRVYPREGSIEYVANGEIGIVVGEYKTKRMTFRPRNLEIEFSSQPSFAYKYYPRAFGDEGSPPLELAYAVTVHKAQGSEFRLTILIVPNPCRLLSRELLYTALTRQRERVVLMYQGSPGELKAYAEPSRSETAARITNLFVDPRPVEIAQRFLEDRLIHRTRRGEAVRSKSEVIIADTLLANGLEYAYERPLVAHDGSIRYPDFTIEDAETGLTVYWEHLGLLHDPAYRERWERKLSWYRRQGILPHTEAPERSPTLLVTRDDLRGGIDSHDIDRLVHEVFEL